MKAFWLGYDVDNKSQKEENMIFKMTQHKLFKLFSISNKIIN